MAAAAMMANPAVANATVAVDPAAYAPEMLMDAGFIVIYLALAIPSMWWWIK
jgi:hypothetical protein